jgi:hypothetical protein
MKIKNQTNLKGQVRQHLTLLSRAAKPLNHEPPMPVGERSRAVWQSVWRRSELG